MDFRDFLNRANTLVNGTTEGEWRTAVSRAYYAAFHVPRELLIDLNFRVPHAERVHGYLWLRLANAGDADVQEAGNRLNALRRERNRSDYDAHLTLHQAMARNHIQRAKGIIQALDAAAIEPIRTQITDAMKIYERDVLKDVTWHP